MATDTNVHVCTTAVIAFTFSLSPKATSLTCKCAWPQFLGKGGFIRWGLIIVYSHSVPECAKKYLVANILFLCKAEIVLTVTTGMAHTCTVVSIQ